MSDVQRFQFLWDRDGKPYGEEYVTVDAYNVLARQLEDSKTLVDKLVEALAAAKGGA